ncbi:DUF4129 domain-containing protein [Haloarcula sp. GH36]|uniref:DUF4129 domain-containing protein n=1 Tax=Haloarcula montana TaxID=3111776 RepID=UPI002D795E57|nr:DUF4129 domain-containing protein [Haloarcula sp. GH36]
MRRLVPVALASLAVLALGLVAASVDTVSTEPAVESTTTPPERTAGSGGAGTATPEADRSQSQGTVAPPARTTTTAAADARGEPPLWQVVAGLGLFLLGSLLALYGLTGGDEAESTEDEERPREPTVPDPSRVTLAGDVPATNDVYRAWRALCAQVEAGDAGDTPAEVATAAVAAGYPEPAVSALTESFCAVRYGDACPTERRERRARELADRLGFPPTEGGAT